MLGFCTGTASLNWKDVAENLKDTPKLSELGEQVLKNPLSTMSYL